MKSFGGKIVGVQEATFIFSLLITMSGGTHIKLSPNYLMEYYYCDGVITFDIKALNVSGWVGFGFNNRSGDMMGSDIFIASYSEFGGEFWGDYHVPLDAGNRLPVLDASQDWNILHIYDNGYETTIFAERNLATGDTLEDMEITDEMIYLIWAYNENSDDVASMHTHSGSVRLNLLDGDNCVFTPQVPTEETTEPGPDPLPTTESGPDPTTAEPTPGICPPTGTDLVEHPTSCSHFYICAEGTAIERECADGLHFNPATKECDFPEHVNCTKPLPNCPPEGVSLYPYPGNCSLYVICVDGTPSVWTCAEGTCYDPDEEKCLVNGTAVSVTPSQVHVGNGSASYREGVTSCGQQKLQGTILIASVRMEQEFYMCHGDKYEATFRCPSGYSFDTAAQKCVPELAS